MDSDEQTERIQDKKWREGYIYIIDYGNQKSFKIGYTTKHPAERLKEISRGTVLMPMKLVAYAYCTTNAYYLEQLIHMDLDSQYVHGEWFDLDFPRLCDVLLVLSIIGGIVEYTDHWYDLVVPPDYEEYIKHGAITSPEIICYSKDKEVRVAEYEFIDWKEAIKGAKGFESLVK